MLPLLFAAVAFCGPPPHGPLCPPSGQARSSATDSAATVVRAPFRVVRFAPLAADTPVPRQRAVEYGDAYYTRLTIHRIGSYVILPVFAGEYYVGQRLLNQGSESDGLKGVHAALASGVVGLFAINTVTGAWNLWDSRHDPEGRTRRTVHALIMMAAGAGFAATALIRPDDDEGEFGGADGFRTLAGSRAHTHRALATGSIALGTAGTVLMWLWR